MNERKKAHDALEHALAAADDRMGRKFNHLTKIGQGLGGVNASAYMAYVWALSWVQSCAYLNCTEQTQSVRAMRKLAPVMLDLYLDKHGIE